MWATTKNTCLWVNLLDLVKLCFVELILGWPESSFRFFCTILTEKQTFWPNQYYWKLKMCSENQLGGFVVLFFFFSTLGRFRDLNSQTLWGKNLVLTTRKFPGSFWQIDFQHLMDNSSPQGDLIPPNSPSLENFESILRDCLTELLCTWQEKFCVTQLSASEFHHNVIFFQSYINR